MIQRIQSLYLLASLVLIGSMFFLDLADLATPEAYYILTASGVVNYAVGGELAMPTLALNLLMVVVFASLLICIFLYKKRMLQIRLCGLNLGLLFGLSVMIFYFGKSAASELAAELSFKWPLVLPLISMVLVFMAIRAIGRDEALVRSLDRIR